LALRPAVFDHHVLPLNEAGFPEILAKRASSPKFENPAEFKVCKKPTTGIAGCCASAASGHAAAAPPSVALKSRRLMQIVV
jgi:hypothetical protein